MRERTASSPNAFRGRATKRFGKRPLPSLRAISLGGALGLGLIVIAIIGCLGWTSAKLRQHTQTVLRDTQSIAMIGDLKVDLLTHNRLGSLWLASLDTELIQMRAGLVDDLNAGFVRARRHLVGPREAALLADAEQRVSIYILERHALEARAGDGEQVAEETQPLLQDAIDALDVLQTHHERRVERAHARAVAVSSWAAASGIGAGGLLVVALVLGALALRRYVVDPVVALRETIERFHQGDLDARALPLGAQETAQIALAFNVMSEALARQRRDQLAFLAGVAHDLKNPLHALKLGLQALSLAPETVPDERAKTYSLLRRQIDRLSRMVGDFLDAARIDAGQLGLALEAFDLRRAAHEISDLYKPLAPAHHIVVDAPARPIVLEADPLRIEQVLGNLLSNAIKYSPEGGEVRIAIESDAQEAVLEVRDQGIGISDTELPLLFAPFRRVASACELAPGTGLGLSMIRRIVQAHGGCIEVESTPNVGSTFRVRLPLANPAAVTTADAGSESVTAD